MLVPIEDKRRTLTQGSHRFAGGTTSFVRAPPGKGGFAFPHTTIGFVLTPQRRHEGRYGTDKVTRMPLDAGMGWVLPAGVEGWCAWDADTEFLNIGLTGDLFAKAGIDPAQVRVGAQVADPLLVQMAIALHEQGGADDTVGAMYREALTFGITSHVAKAFAGGVEDERPARGPDPRIARAIDYVEAHLAEELSIEVLAGVAALSPFHFAKTFKQATGLPPHRFVAARRVERAKVLLGTTALPIAEIAYRVGWENVSHFTQAFRTATGTTPGAWRAGA